jgi:hypothetical protein
MPDFTSHVNLMPEDKITPAINDFTNTLMKVEMVKRAEDERKMARLTDLATFALGDMTNRDNAAIQKMAEEFKNSLVPLYQQSEKNGMKGYLPYPVQADLNAKKAYIMRMAGKAEQDKKDFYDLNKMMATNKDIDQEKTKRGVDAWYNEPIDKRGPIYSAVRLNFDVNEYFKNNIINDPKKWTELSGKNGAGTYDIERYAKEDVLGQMVDMYQNNPRLKQEVDDRMAEEGIKAKNIGDVKNAMDKWQWADKFVVDNMNFKQDNRTNIYNISGTEDTPTGTAATNSRIIKSNVTPTGQKIIAETKDGKPLVVNKEVNGKPIYETLDGKVVDIKDVFTDEKGNVTGGYMNQTLETGNIATVKNVNVSFMASSNNVNISTHGDELNTISSSNLDMKVNGVQPLRSYYSEKANRWFPATKEWIAAHPKEKTEMKRYIVGAKDVYDPDDKKTYEGDAYAVPATKANVDQLRKQLGPKSPISTDLEDNFGKPTKSTSSSGQSQQASIKVSKTANAKKPLPVDSLRNPRFKDGESHYFSNGKETHLMHWDSKTNKWIYDN